MLFLELPIGRATREVSDATTIASPSYPPCTDERGARYSRVSLWVQEARCQNQVMRCSYSVPIWWASQQIQLRSCLLACSNRLGPYAPGLGHAAIILPGTWMVGQDWVVWAPSSSSNLLLFFCLTFWLPRMGNLAHFVPEPPTPATCHNITRLVPPPTQPFLVCSPVPCATLGSSDFCRGF